MTGPFDAPLQSGNEIAERHLGRSRDQLEGRDDVIVVNAANVRPARHGQRDAT